MTTLDENNAPWSPAFNLDDSTSYMFQDFSNADFDIFTDPTSSLVIPGNGSPEKRSAKRPRLDRAKSTNLLSDISNVSPNKRMSSTPLLKFTPSMGNFNSPFAGLMDSPSKLLGLDSPTKIASSNFNLAAFDLPQEDFFSTEFLAEDINEGWDIMQGFQKIGSGSGHATQNMMKRSPKARPGLGRSFTSRF